MIGKPVFIKNYSLAEWKEVINLGTEKTLSAGVYFVVVEQRSKRKVIKLVTD
jgi:hypothetical protein